ncbi:LacI family DNA-binding transcriptional regulator [Nitratireductor sp. PBL-C9]|uniref:LacI family DNA-binding transcriptional regulator n=1 Tax=Nitratireductor sp. PBL-C9 TaxID=3435013 RepID=UPI003D7ECD37
MSRRKSGTATSHDVARVANVSQALVSRAFTGNGRIAPETRERILKAAEQVGWQPNALARSMVTGDAPLVAVITTRLNFDWRAQVLSRLLKAIQEWHLKPLLFYAESDAEVDRLLEEALSWRARGVIVTAGVVRENRAAAIIEKGQFLVALNRPANHEKGFSVATDNPLGGRMAAGLFVEEGRRRLLVLGGPQGSWAPSLRAEGFSEAAREAGLHAAIWNNDAMSTEAGRACAERLLALPGNEQPDAVFATNDAMALGFLDGLRGHRSIPDDIALIGFDNLPAADWPPYRLTTFEQPLEEMMRRLIAHVDVHGDGHSGGQAEDQQPQEESEPRARLIHCKPKLITRMTAGKTE